MSFANGWRRWSGSVRTTPRIWFKFLRATSTDKSVCATSILPHCPNADSRESCCGTDTLVCAGGKVLTWPPGLQELRHLFHRLRVEDLFRCQARFARHPGAADERCVFVNRMRVGIDAESDAEVEGAAD